MALRGKLIDALANNTPGDSTAPSKGGSGPKSPVSSGKDVGYPNPAVLLGRDADNHTTAGDNRKTVYRNRKPVPMNYLDSASYDRSVVKHIKIDTVKDQTAIESSIKNEVLYMKNDYSGFKVQARENWDIVKGQKFFNFLMKEKEVQGNNIMKKERV